MYIPFPPKPPWLILWCKITLFVRSYTFLPTLLFLILLTAPSYFFAGHSALFDLCTRISINDAPLGTYYFWWTSMTYLPTFFFFTFFIALLTQPYLMPSTVVFFLFVVFGNLYTTEISDYIISNQNLFISTYSSSGLNTLLTNVLNRYHPLIFYLSTFLLLTWSFFVLNSSTTDVHFTAESSHASGTFVHWGTLFINLVALWMGSWWALQEGTWGGWWNWDSSEVFGLFVTLVVLSTTHSKTIIRSLEYNRHKVGMLVLIFLASYIFIQLNFELVSHNFGSKFFFFFNNNLFFIQLLLTSTLLLIYIYSLILLGKRDKDLVYLHSKNNVRVRTNSTMLRFIPSFILSLWVIVSYKPLLNYFLWNFFDMNFFNSENTFQSINCVLIIVVLAWFTVIQKSHLLILVFLSVLTSHHLLIPLTLFILSNSTYRYHMFFVLITALNLLLFDNIIYRWGIHTYYHYKLLGHPLAVSMWAYPTTDSYSVELVQSTLTSQGRLDLSWNLASVTNVPALNFFNLVSSSTSFYNLYELASNYTSVHLYIELPLLPSLNLLFWIPWLYLIMYISKSNVFNKI